ncbi:MAG: DHH family phosphoesterase, partial [Anaerolineae bacterium]
MNWTFPPEPDIPPDLRAWAGDDLLARLLVQRGIATVQAARAFTTPNDYEPAPPAALPDMALAVARLSDAIDRRTPICVWGDFDVDGQTATALLVDALRALGAEARYYVPHRLTEGHGIGGERLEQVLQDGAKLILTCDTGIEAHKAVETIHRAGVAVIITDHHDPGQTLPPAEAVINPKRLPADHPLRELPGVGVAFKLVEGLAGARGQPQLAEPLLDLVALGIVADVATQTGDTRYLLQRGLQVLRHTQRPGLLALIKMSNLRQEHLTA